MKYFILAIVLFVASCANSPEGSTNTEGSGSSISPGKTGDTSRNKVSDNGGGGQYDTDTMPGKGKKKGSDSTVLNQQDSATLKMNAGVRHQ